MKQRVNRSSPLMRGAIVAMTQARVIGVDGGLPWHYSEDLKRFKRITMGSAIIMGRITWESIGCKALPGRRNIVISRSAVPGVEHYDGIEQAFTACQGQDLWVIGGAQIYSMAMKFLNRLDVTYVPDIIEYADAAKFPIIDSACWNATAESTLPDDSSLTHVVYRRVVEG